MNAVSLLSCNTERSLFSITAAFKKTALPNSYSKKCKGVICKRCTHLEKQQLIIFSSVCALAAGPSKSLSLRFASAPLILYGQFYIVVMCFKQIWFSLSSNVWQHLHLRFLWWIQMYCRRHCRLKLYYPVVLKVFPVLHNKFQSEIFDVQKFRQRRFLSSFWKLFVSDSNFLNTKKFVDVFLLVDFSFSTGDVCS